jgi:hypothetical protein
MAQLGTIKLQTDSGIVDVPVFDISDFSNSGSTIDALRVQTDSGIGAIPLTDPADASNPQEAIRVQTDSGIKAVNDSATVVPKAGKRMVIGDNSSGSISLFELSSAFDLSTRTQTSSTSIASGRIDEGIHINSGGGFLHTGDGDGNIAQFSLSTAFDLSTATLDTSVNFSSGNTHPTFADNGSKFYVTEDFPSDRLIEFDLTTPFDISTRTQINSVSAPTGSTRDMAVIDSGNRLYVKTGGDLFQFDLLTPFDLSSRSKVRQAALPTGSALRSMAIKDDGSRMIMAEISSNTIREFDFGTNFNISTLSQLDSFNQTSTAVDVN